MGVFMEKINFKSRDGLLITADYYKVDNTKGFIVLCHRSYCNSAEYRETAPKLNALGYSCLAIDQRSGMKVFGEVNETKDRAKERGLATGYLDAKVDVESAVEYAYELHGKNKIILFGSSYSASLALLIAAKSNKVSSVIVFSPGEYLKKTDLAEEIRNLKIPIFATSPKKEIEQVGNVLRYVDKRYVTHFRPSVEGFHGSKTLWESVKGYELYWDALKIFIRKMEEKNEQ